MIRRKSIELYFDGSPNIIEQKEGTKITGRLAYPGISKNGKLYTVEQLMHGHNVNVPIWLNHAGTLGLQDIGPDLLPDEYRAKLEKGEIIKLGESHLTFNQDTLELLYEGYVTDPFYKQKKILKKMSVSQGVLHYPINPAESPCDAVTCYALIRGSMYEEMSLVFHPGFSIATLSAENQNSYELARQIQSIMQPDNTKKSGESGDCGCKGSEADQRKSGTMSEAGNCGAGQVFDSATGKCVPVPESGNPVTNAGGAAPDQVAGEAEDDYDKKMKEKDAESKKAKEALDAASKAVEAARKALEASKDMPSGSDGSPDETGKKQKEESKKNSTENDGSWMPNQDVKSRARAQEAYNDALEQRFKAMENYQASILAMTKFNMTYAAEHATKKAMIGPNDKTFNLSKARENAEQSPMQWLRAVGRRSTEVAGSKIWNIDNDYIFSTGLVGRRFKVAEGYDIKSVPYDKFMGLKASEATDVQMAGNGAQPDAFLRTGSELVLVYPNGIVVTPIEQFCETKVLEPGIKEELFWDVNVPDFAATDESNMDAGGSGYALQPTEITINATGGNTNPQGGLVRLGFTQLEEIPIDVVQKINVGFAMRAAQRKNFEVLSTCFNDMTAYDPATMSRRPQGGGNKFATDNQGNTHMVNGNTGAQLTSTDSGATSAATFAGLLAAKKTIADTGLDVENLFMYTNWGTILQFLKDTSITTYTQRSVPEVITEGVIEKLSGVQLVASNDLATGDAATVKRSVMFIPTVSFKMVIGRELQIDAERVARQQSVFLSASMKMKAYLQRIESTCGFSSNPAA